MTDDDRKMLTEYLGECWHKHIVDSDSPIDCSCGSPGIHDNRTFTTWGDLGALVCKMVERGDWGIFANHVAKEEWNAYEYSNPEWLRCDFTSWLITDPARTCNLIAEWLRDRP